MRTRSFVVVVVAAFLMLGGAASAQRGSGSDALEECFGPGPLSMREAEMDCVKVEGGEWTPVAPSDPVSSFKGLFVLFAILGSLAPGLVGMAIARDANVSPGIGLLIGLFGSWVGVIALYLYGNSQKTASRVITGGPDVAARELDEEPRPPEGENPAAERLRTLRQLREEGLITEDEYHERRAAAIESL